MSPSSSLRTSAKDKYHNHARILRDKTVESLEENEKYQNGPNEETQQIFILIEKLDERPQFVKHE